MRCWTLGQLAALQFSEGRQLASSPRFSLHTSPAVALLHDLITSQSPHWTLRCQYKAHAGHDHPALKTAKPCPHPCWCGLSPVLMHFMMLRPNSFQENASDTYVLRFMVIVLRGRWGGELKTGHNDYHHHPQKRKKKMSYCLPLVGHFWPAIQYSLSGLQSSPLALSLLQSSLRVPSFLVLSLALLTCTDQCPFRILCFSTFVFSPIQL